MGFGFWLRILLGLEAFWGTGSKETVLGTLGRATLLRVPRELLQLHQNFSEAAWKESLEGQQKKKILLRFSPGNLMEFDQGRVRFHREDFSLEILNTTRGDSERIFEFSLSQGQEEEVWQVQLRVFEPVSHPEIQILHREFSNGSCSLTLLCSSEKGDEISYIWENRDNGTFGMCSGFGETLNVSLSPGTGSGCVCTAQNAVSSAWNQIRVTPELCWGTWGGGVPGVGTVLLVVLVTLGLVFVVAVVVVIVIVTVRATKGDQVTPQDSPDSAGATIYAQVQKPKGIVPKATPVSCTTIYAAATGPRLAPEGSLWSPNVSPNPRGQSPLSQEPTTVYATVTLPVA